MRNWRSASLPRLPQKVKITIVPQSWENDALAKRDGYDLVGEGILGVYEVRYGQFNWVSDIHERKDGTWRYADNRARVFHSRDEVVKHAIWEWENYLDLHYDDFTYNKPTSHAITYLDSPPPEPNVVNEPTSSHCKDCNGTKTYTGLFDVGPCKTCC